jgi:hypothetical protein
MPLLAGFNRGIKEDDMISAQPEPEAAITGSPSLVLEIGGQHAQTPFQIPVRALTLSMGLVTLAVGKPWLLADWERYRGRNCVLRLEGPSGEQLIDLKAKISWSKYNDDSQSTMLLGLKIAKPSGEAFKRLSDHITHCSQDIKGLWERYDQVRTIPAHSHLAHHFYLAGLGLLIGGVVLQFSSSPAYKMFGWVLWLLGSLGLAGKLFYSLRQKQISR